MGRKDSNSRSTSSDAREKRDKRAGRPVRKKVCMFCKDKIDYIDFKDVSLMRKFTSDRGKIRARRVTGTCVQHQHEVASAIKNAREVALIPYVVR
ncbi:MAG: 30S ribosomal protein S18 [Actinomycetota bacterium]